MSTSASHPLGRAQHDAADDHAAHRVAEQGDPLGADRLDHRERVGGQPVEGVVGRVLGRVALAVAPVVEDRRPGSGRTARRGDRRSPPSRPRSRGPAPASGRCRAPRPRARRRRRPPPACLVPPRHAPRPPRRRRRTPWWPTGRSPANKRDLVGWGDGHGRAGAARALTQGALDARAPHAGERGAARGPGLPDRLRGRPPQAPPPVDGRLLRPGRAHGHRRDRAVGLALAAGPGRVRHAGAAPGPHQPLLRRPVRRQRAAVHDRRRRPADQPVVEEHRLQRDGVRLGRARAPQRLRRPAAARASSASRSTRRCSSRAPRGSRSWCRASRSPRSA